MYFNILYLLFLFVIIKGSEQKYVGYKDYKGYKGVSVSGDAVALKQFEQEISEYDDILLIGVKEVHDYLVPKQLFNTFANAAVKKKLKLETIYEDYSEIIKDEKNIKKANRFSWDSYYDVDTIYEYLEHTHKAYANLTQLVVGGMSYEGREILGLRIISPYEEDQEKPAIFIESGIHAREWITPAASTYFINQLLSSDDDNIRHLRDTYDWHIFPTVNPDGYHYSYTKDRMWRKTRSQSDDGCYGADPNRNWDHNWRQHGASNNPCNYQTYAGSKPFSEVETRTLSEYITGVRNLIAYIGLHADAQMLLVPYSDSVSHEDNYDDLITIGKTSLEYGKKVNGANYDGPATAAEILYKASGGSMDWVREALGTPIVFTYELRGRFFHWPPHRIPEQGEELTQMILGLVVEAENMKYFK